MTEFKEGQLRLPYCAIHDKHPSDCFLEHHPGLELDNGERIDEMREKIERARDTKAP